MGPTLKGHAQLGQAFHVRTPGAQKPNAAARSRAMLFLASGPRALTAGQLVGQRYIDPGSGSFAIQNIIAAVLGGILSGRLWLRHVFWRIVGRGRRKE